MLILKFFSYIFLFFVKVRLFLYESGILKSYKIKDVKVISVGNISLGGTGKTPVTIEIAKNLLTNGYKISVLLRGYKRKDKGEILTVSDGKKIFYTAEQCGDEAYLIAKKLKCPVVVSKNRIKGAKYLKEKFQVDFIILDDGFQHLKLQRDIDIVLVTQKSLNEKVFLLPAKKYREPISHLKRASFIVVTKIYNRKKLKINCLLLKHLINRKVYVAEIILNNFIDINGNLIDKNLFKGKKVAIFCGIAQPEYFEKLLIENQIIVKEKIYFPDHHFFSEKDYRRLNSIENYPLITTEKDIVKLNLNKLKTALYVADISYKFFKIV